MFEIGKLILVCFSTFSPFAFSLEQPPPPAPFLPAKLSEVELLLIVSALLFLTLLLLGIGMGYYCLKRRNIKVIRKIPPPEIPYIPRVSVSSSEVSEYSESRSILSETSTIQRDHFRYENMGYLPEPKYSHGGYDDMYNTGTNDADLDEQIVRQNVIAPPVPIFSTQFMNDRYITNASMTSIEEDIERGRLIVPTKPKITTLVTDEYYITPMHTTEIVDEIITQKVIVPKEKPLTTKTIDDTFITPQSSHEIDEETVQNKVFGPPKRTTKTVDDYYLHPEEDTEVTEETTTHRIFGPRKPVSVKTVTDSYLHPENDTELTEETTFHRVYGPRKGPVVKTVDDTYLHPESEIDITTDITDHRLYGGPSEATPSVLSRDEFYRDVYEIDEIIDDSVSQRIISGPTTQAMQTTEDEYTMRSRQVEEFIDDQRRQMLIRPKPKPTYTVKNTDDFYITKLEETEIDEKVTKIGRSMPNLLLEIDYDDEDDDNETSKQETNTTTFDITMRSIPLGPKPSTTSTTLTDTTRVHTSETFTKFDSILRIIENPPTDRVPNITEHFPLPTRNKLRTVILTDHVFRSIIIESSTVEEYHERIIRSPTYSQMFEPLTWEVIFRILSLPEIVNAPVEPRDTDP